jgi:hypothetical protein
MFRAWYAALIAGSASVIMTAWSIAALDGAAVGDWIMLADAGLVLLLGWGVSRKSRVAAALLLSHLLILRGLALLTAGGLLPLAIVLVFGYLYFDGLRGTLTHHRLRSQPDIRLAF